MSPKGKKMIAPIVIVFLLLAYLAVYVILIAGADAAFAAKVVLTLPLIALGTALSATDRAPAATILLGDDDTLLLAADYPGLDLLILTGKAPGEEARRAYFGENYGPEREFTGYYGDGTARAAAPARGRLAFSSRATMQRILDWQGSALGHAVEIPDDDEIFRRIDAYRIAAVFCVAAAGLIWPLRRKRL